MGKTEFQPASPVRSGKHVGYIQVGDASMGRSIVVSRDGIVVEIPPEDVVKAEDLLLPRLRQAL